MSSTTLMCRNLLKMSISFCTLLSPPGSFFSFLLVRILIATLLFVPVVFKMVHMGRSGRATPATDLDAAAPIHA